MWPIRIPPFSIFWPTIPPLESSLHAVAFPFARDHRKRGEATLCPGALPFRSFFTEKLPASQASHVQRTLFRCRRVGLHGPFFAESQLNRELPPLQWPFTYAHEYSHLLGISSEAEANFWAYQICIRSVSPAVRYSGYFGLLPYVLSNAATLLEEEDYRQLLASIRPEILQPLREKQAYWQARYNPWVGRVQELMYEYYLKGNQIPSGQKNYAEVVAMILALPGGWWK